MSRTVRICGTIGLAMAVLLLLGVAVLAQTYDWDDYDPAWTVQDSIAVAAFDISGEWDPIWNNLDGARSANDSSYMDWNASPTESTPEVIAVRGTLGGVATGGTIRVHWSASAKIPEYATLGYSLSPEYSSVTWSTQFFYSDVMSDWETWVTEWEITGTYRYIWFRQSQRYGNIQVIDAIFTYDYASFVSDSSPCVNGDSELISSTLWSEIQSPTWITGGGVLLDYGDGVQQSVVITSGYYALQVTATLPVSFPVDRSGLRMCLNESCAIAPVTGTIGAVFNVLAYGQYDLSVVNLSSSRVFTGSSAVTMTYACLSALDNACLVLDPDMDNVRMPTFAGEQGWQTVYPDVGQVGGALLGCDQSVEQWVYLESRTYTMTLHAHSDFVRVNVFNGYTSPTSATLTVRLGPEDNPAEDFRDYLVIVHSVDHDNLGDPDYNAVYQVSFDVSTEGNYLLSFHNYGCKDNAAELIGNYVWLDYVCLGDEARSSINRVGQCASLIDAGFGEYQAVHWDQSSGASWSPGYMALQQGAAISQTAGYSSTAEMTNTTWIVYSVARSNYTATLRLALGGSGDEVSVVGDNTFAIYTATITSTMPVSVSISALTGTADLDFVCVYSLDTLPVGEWGNGIDGDTDCIQPKPPPGGLSFSDAVQAWLGWIVDWIKYLICELLIWLRKIWMAIINQIREIAIDLGLDLYWQAFMAWLREIVPYDAILIGVYIINLVFELAARLFGLLKFVSDTVLLFINSIFFGLNFAVSMIGAAWQAFTVPCEAMPLSVPEATVYGFLLAINAIEAIPVITYAEYMVIGFLAIKIVMWTIAAFTLGGGGE